EWLNGVPGQIALYPLLGAFPGLALSWALMPRASTTTRWVTGLTLAPLVSSILGWAAMTAGLSIPLAARAIGAASWLIWVAAIMTRRRGAPADPDEDAPPSRAMWALSLSLAFAIALPHFLNPWMLIKSDAWLHAGLVHQILERGIPPEDPRFAGLRLNYVWFFNLFIALLTRVHDSNPFVFMTLLNVVDVVLVGWLAWLLGWALWRSREGALGAALLTSFGFNALAWLTWPTRGISGVSDLFHGRGTLHFAWPALPLESWRIMSDLGAPYAWIENFADKFITGTSLSYAWLLMMLALWSILRVTRGAGPGAWVIACLSTAGMVLWHGVVGLSVGPVAVCAVVLMLVVRPFFANAPAARRLGLAGLAAGIGMLLATPYTLSISQGWDARRTGMHVSPVHVDAMMIWTLVTSTAFVLLFAWRPVLEILKERRGDAAWFVADAAGIYAFSVLIALPNNNEAKFPFEAFVPLAVLGAAGFMRWTGAIRARAGAAGIALLGAALALPLVLTLVGFTLDPERLVHPALNPAPGENQLYAWIASRTPRDMVFVDARYRDLIMVRARRQLYLGSSSGPERAAFPLAQVLSRRAVMADLYGPAVNLDRDVSALALLGRPAAVLYRAADASPGTRPGAALASRPDLFRTLYDRDGFVLYAVRMPKAAASGTHS
ncbi:MAG TPA: hypothetical protein VL123_09160, partial [Candidatus Udaeobacter sp.]|nr:hypothetical protein [Candidatus Udaeobacter sp.]